MRQGIGAIAAFAALPFVTLTANNPGQPLPVGRFALYWIALVVPLSVVVIVVGRRDKLIAARVAAVLGLSVYAVTQLSMMIQRAIRLGRIYGIDAAVWLGVALILVAVLVTRWNWVQSYVPLLAALLLFPPAAQIGARIIAHGSETPAISSAATWDLTPSTTPNIYWFVLDGYTRGDVLADVYKDTEHRGFLQQLDDRGFSVSRQAMAAYPMTYLSVSSTLSGEYLADEGDQINQMGPFYRRIQGDNPVVRTLRSWGYSYVLVPGDQWTGTECSGWEDLCLDTAPIREAEWALLRMTPFGRLFGGRAAELHSERSDPAAAVKAIEASKPDTPMFALIHLMNPHPPYYHSGEDCALQEAEYDLQAPWGNQEYVDAIRCLNHQLLEAVDRIIASDDGDAIIILQGDHGPNRGVRFLSGYDLSEWTPEQFYVRLSVLSAMRLPDGCEPPLDMNLVNTFRVVFDCIAAEDVSLLPTRTWIANMYPGDIKEVDSTRMLNGLSQ